jgi:6-phosphofructokinase 1
MVNRHVTENRLEDIAGKARNIPETCDLLAVARRMGVCLG